MRLKIRDRKAFVGMIRDLNIVKKIFKDIRKELQDLSSCQDYCADGEMHADSVLDEVIDILSDLEEGVHE